MFSCFLGCPYQPQEHLSSWSSCFSAVLVVDAWMIWITILLMEAPDLANQLGPSSHVFYNLLNASNIVNQTYFTILESIKSHMCTYMHIAIDYYWPFFGAGTSFSNPSVGNVYSYFTSCGFRCAYQTMNAQSGGLRCPHYTTWAGWASGDFMACCDHIFISKGIDVSAAARKATSNFSFHVSHISLYRFMVYCAALNQKPRY